MDGQTDLMGLSFPRCAHPEGLSVPLQASLCEAAKGCCCGSPPSPPRFSVQQSRVLAADTWQPVLVTDKLRGGEKVVSAHIRKNIQTFLTRFMATTITYFKF